jgi:hypothetical protein
LDIIGYDLAGVVKKSINSGESIVGGDYRGCLGNFSINKKLGLQRDLQIFYLDDSEKVELTPTEIEEDEK